jgi:hypothetical protein
MKTKFGAIIVDGRGKIGGHVAAKNRAGSYLRTKVTPVNPKSPAQSAIRARLSQLASAWRGLTSNQIAAWNKAVNDYSKTDIFGDVKNPTGFNLYQKLNNNLLRVGGAVISNPPLPIAVPSFITFTAAQVHAGATTLTFTATPVPAGVAVEISATPPMSNGINFVKSEFRIVTTIAAAAVSPSIITLAYNTVFGAPGAAGQKLYFKAKFISLVTGQAGNPVQCSCMVS